MRSPATRSWSGKRGYWVFNFLSSLIAQLVIFGELRLRCAQRFLPRTTAISRGAVLAVKKISRGSKVNFTENAHAKSLTTTTEFHDFDLKKSRHRALSRHRELDFQTVSRRADLRG